ncbi:MAG: DUF4426 domain-containing protein [Spiribacter sp.]|jgi:hypothetical protein|nr:DUF4426 domain-containing protein [Spiribacter sp.]MDR9488851.1 DUF4426 domain-containing protein [Spiribacter sp.]
MNTQRRLTIGLIVSVLMCIPILAPAQQSQRFGDYDIHYSALPTGIMNEAVAEEYGILRSRTRGMVMITVLRDGKAVSARLNVLARDENDDLREIPARAVKQDDWVSYVGVFPVAEAETLVFEVEIRPHAGGGPFEFAFRQSFHAGG